MRYLHLFLWLALIAGPSAAPAYAQGAAQEYATEARLLEADLDRYLEARQRESEAINRVRDLARQVDDALADPNAPVSELRTLEASFAAGRESAFARLQDTSAARLRMYDRMDRLARLAQQMEKQTPAPVAAEDAGPDGPWQFNFESLGIYALVDMEFTVSGFDRSFVVSGPYRTSNGHQGTVQGTFSSNRFTLEVLDSRRGKVAVLDGAVSGQGRLQGTWQAVITGLGGDRPQGGAWSGHRVASASEVSFD